MRAERSKTAVFPEKNCKKMLKIPLCMVSPEALPHCCNTATAIIYENIKTKNKSTIYKDALQEGEVSGEEQDLHGGSAWDAALNQALSGAVEMVDLLDELKKTVQLQAESYNSENTTDIKGSNYSSKRRGHHYIYVLTNTVSLQRLELILPALVSVIIRILSALFSF